jgi:galactose mutarotase-like enzyme
MTSATEEMFSIGSGDLLLTIYPGLGGKIASIRVRELEFLQRPLSAYRTRTRTMPFDESDASGWDECLPSVAGCDVETTEGLLRIPDHGDLWRVPWETVEAGPRSCALRGQCFSVPLALRREIAIQDTEAGWRIDVHYTLTNTGEFTCPWSWAAHPLFAVETGDRILMPASIHALRLEGSTGARLGSTGATVAWPVTNPGSGGVTDLSKVESAQSGIGEKLFAGPLGEKENWCALERPTAGARIRVGFDPVATPYLGLWLCYGGWPTRPGAKQVCVAMEPSTTPVDSLALSGSRSRTLKPGASFRWPMTLEIEKLR